MNRIERVREYIDCVLEKLPDAEERRYAYIHVYGVAQACALLAMKRGESTELAIVAGMLHDVYRYTKREGLEHAHRGAELAREILNGLGDFEAEEIDRICDAVYHHSSKRVRHSTFAEVLKDADVMQHCLYDPTMPAVRNDWERYERLKRELELNK